MSLNRSRSSSQSRWRNVLSALGGGSSRAGPVVETGNVKYTDPIHLSLHGNTLVFDDGDWKSSKISLSKLLPPLIPIIHLRAVKQNRARVTKNAQWLWVWKKKKQKTQEGPKRVWKEKNQWAVVMVFLCFFPLVLAALLQRLYSRLEVQLMEANWMKLGSPLVVLLSWEKTKNTQHK